MLNNKELRIKAKPTGLGNGIVAGKRGVIGAIPTAGEAEKIEALPVTGSGRQSVESGTLS